MMGYLSVVFNNYYNSTNNKEKINIKREFLNRLWNSSVPYEKYEKTFHFRIAKSKVDNELFELFEKYNRIPYKILKSRYNINELEKEDLIKLRINSNYGKYIDKEIYLDKSYYKCMNDIRNLYFFYINGECSLDLSKELQYIYDKAEKIKIDSQNKKIDMSWDNYKGFINNCFDKIFNNYIPLDEKIESGEFYPNKFSDWDEDNYIVGYVNKSLNGYMNNYYNETKGKIKRNITYKYCTECGKMIELITKNSNKKYCEECKKSNKYNQNKISRNKLKMRKT